MSSPAAPFRFGVVAPVMSSPAVWRDEVRRIADQGYSTVLMPDVPGWQPAPGPALAVAASLTNLRVGTWVYASPLRPASTLAWEAHSMSELTDGRFDLGIGTGRPGLEELLRELGLPILTAGQRVTRIQNAVGLLREYDGPDRHTPVVMAVRGPRARALAAEVADMVTFVMSPETVGTRWCRWRGTFLLFETSRSRCMSRSSETPLRRSWPARIPIQPRSEQLIPWRSCRPTPPPPSRRYGAAGRR